MTSNLAMLIVLDGIAYGSLMFLVAVGLSLIFGVLQILNVAHGSFYAIGAYAAASFGLATAATGVSPWLNFPLLLLAAALTGVLLGGLIELLLLRRIYGKEQDLQLLVTFAVFMILEDLQKMVWGVKPYFMGAPLQLLGTVEAMGVTYSVYQLGLLPAVAVLVFLGLRFLLKRTFAGRVLRAVTEDREAAQAMGINSKKVFLLTFIAGGCLAALAGALAAGSSSIVPGLGAQMTIMSFAIAATAGLGQIEGAAIAALMIGLGRSLAVYFAPELDVVIPFAIMFCVLLFKPAGLFSLAATRKV